MSQQEARFQCEIPVFISKKVARFSAQNITTGSTISARNSSIYFQKSGAIFSTKYHNR
jgi:primosomal replication protein N